MIEYFKLLPLPYRVIAVVAIANLTAIGGGAWRLYVASPSSCSVAAVAVQGPGKVDGITMLNNKIEDNCNGR